MLAYVSALTGPSPYRISAPNHASSPPGAGRTTVDCSTSAVDIESFARHLVDGGQACATFARRLSTVVGFCRYAEEEGVIDHSPAVHIRRPRIDYESHAAHLDRNELGAILVTAGVSSARDCALVSLLASNGLRISEAIGADIDALGLERGHRTLTVLRKGGRIATMPLAPRVARSMDLAMGERVDGPIFIDAAGQRLDRYAAGRIVRRVARQAGITKRVGPTPSCSTPTWRISRPRFARATTRRRTLTLRRWAQHVAPLSVRDATGNDVDEFRSGYQAQAIRHAYHADLAGFYKWCGRRGLIAQNRMLMTDAPCQPKGLPRPLPIEVLADALRIAPQVRTQTELLLGALAGLRVSEMAALHTADIDLNAELPILVVRRGKGGHDRTVPLHPALVEQLRGVPTGWVFETLKGDPDHVSGDWISERVGALLRAAAAGSDTQRTSSDTISAPRRRGARTGTRCWSRSCSVTPRSRRRRTTSGGSRPTALRSWRGSRQVSPATTSWRAGGCNGSRSFLGNATPSPSTVGRARNPPAQGRTVRPARGDRTQRPGAGIGIPWRGLLPCRLRI